MYNEVNKNNKYELIDEIKNELEKDIISFFLVKEIHMDYATLRKLTSEIYELNKEDSNCINEEKYLLNLSDDELRQYADKNNGLIGSFLNIPIRIMENLKKYTLVYFSEDEIGIK